MGYDICMEPKIAKCLTSDGQAIISAVSAGAVIQESMKRIRAFPPAMYHLGSAMMSALLCQSLPDRQENEKLDFQWKCDEGPFSSLYVECRNRSQIRGTILNPQTVSEDLKVSMGPGLLQARRLLPLMATPLSTGIISAKGDVVLDVLNYLEMSEQKICALSVWIDIVWDDNSEDEKVPFQVRQAYGFLVHVLPQESLEKTHEILFQWDQHIQRLGPISQWELGKQPLETILRFLSGEKSPNMTWEKKIESFCSCDEDRAARALAFVDRQDVLEKVNNIPTAGTSHEVRCEFCGKTYVLKSLALG